MWAGAAAVLLAGAIAVACFPTVPPGSAQHAQATPTTHGPAAPVAAKSAAAGEISRAGAPLRLVYPGAGADIAIHPLTPTAAELTAGEVDPPQTQDAYWLTNYGRPGAGSTDTTFLISHRWVGQDAPFNRIGNVAKAGDRFTLSTQNGVLDLAVSTVTTFDKATLNTAPIWNAVPGRVVIITCDLRDPWGKNTVITADPTLHRP
ncbi:class F sortase [Specibacter sp. RAF43]|uniref:class F sortase n=1 Tax=Specibacter sp. RAF43 TaxID=3233057 RepID=UPI003F945CF7